MIKKKGKFKVIMETEQKIAKILSYYRNLMNAFKKHSASS